MGGRERGREREGGRVRGRERGREQEGGRGRERGREEGKRKMVQRRRKLDSVGVWESVLS